MTVWHNGSKRVLFKWRGSVWRAVWKELLIFLILYFIINFWYRFGMKNKDYRKLFQTTVLEFEQYLNMIPITFLLGFYVSSMVSRYFTQFLALPVPDDLYAYANLLLPKDDDVSVMRRRTIVRYLVLSIALSWRDISTRVRKRFPRMDSFVTAGLMTKNEYQIYKKQVIKNMEPLLKPAYGAAIWARDAATIVTDVAKDLSQWRKLIWMGNVPDSNNVDTIHWSIPMDWCQRIVEQLLDDEKSLAPPLASHFVQQLSHFREQFRTIHVYNWVSVPLAYTQVATGATYAYFLFCLIGRQFLDPNAKIKNHEVDFYIPIFTTLQFLFYVGWLKVGFLSVFIWSLHSYTTQYGLTNLVGQCIMHPFGESDDDFELNALLDRHLKVGLLCVDGRQRHLPPLQVDAFFHCDDPTLPHTEASRKVREAFPKVRSRVRIKAQDQHMIIPTDDLASVHTETLGPIEDSQDDDPRISPARTTEYSTSLNGSNHPMSPRHKYKRRKPDSSHRWHVPRTTADLRKVLPWNNSIGDTDKTSFGSDRALAF